MINPFKHYLSKALDSLRSFIFDHCLEFFTVGLILILIVSLVGCSSLAPIAGAGGGAALGSLAGPGGAALGGAAGAAAGEIMYPAEQVAPPPDTVWGLLAKLLAQATGMAVIAGLLSILTLFAPPPKEWFKRK